MTEPVPDRVERAARAFYEADPIVDVDEVSGRGIPRPWDSNSDRYRDHLRGLVKIAIAAVAEPTDPPYCESCEADHLWETEGIQPVWASPTHTRGTGVTENENRPHEVPAVGDVVKILGSGEGGLVVAWKPGGFAPDESLAPTVHADGSTT